MEDCYDRYLIRNSRNARKYLESLHNVINNIPQGSVKIDNYKFIAPPKGK
jgi:NADH:ubiquinone oxidoreductase subunit D